MINHKKNFVTNAFCKSKIEPSGGLKLPIFSLDMLIVNKCYSQRHANHVFFLAGRHLQTIIFIAKFTSSRPHSVFDMHLLKYTWHSASKISENCQSGRSRLLWWRSLLRGTSKIPPNPHLPYHPRLQQQQYRRLLMKKNTKSFQYRLSVMNLFVHTFCT